MMPERTGMQIFATIKNVSPHTKIIIYTGFPEYRDSVYARMADGFILKKDTPEALLQLMEKI